MMSPLDHDATLAKLRAGLTEEEALMRRGIFTDADTGRDYFTGYAYKTLYDWDQYFEAIVQIYMGWPSTYIKNGVTIFLDHQRESGLISRSVPSNDYHDPEHVKPFLAQMAVMVARAYGETDWILNDHTFPRLQRYLDTWLAAMDGNGDGLSEWMSAPHTGMDNQHERAGYWGDRFSEGVDLNSYLVRELRAFAYLAERYEKPALAAAYAEKAEARAALGRRGWLLLRRQCARRDGAQEPQGRVGCGDEPVGRPLDPRQVGRRLHGALGRGRDPGAGAADGRRAPLQPPRVLDALPGGGAGEERAVVQPRPPALGPGVQLAR
jgi:hypothetical protein